MKNKEDNIHFPIDSPTPNLPFPQAELDPLLKFISSNHPIPKTEKSFQRGTITSEGKLDCCMQDLGAVGAKLLAKALKENMQIKSILFGTNKIGDEGAKSVAALIKENPHIETVYLSSNKIKASGAIALAEGLENNTSVRALWLKRNPIGDEGAKSIIHLLQKNRHIRSLDLVNTQIGLKSLTYLVDTLIQENYPLERLYLSGNTFGAEAGPIIAKLLTNNTQLKELYLSVNLLGNLGTIAIAKALQQNSTLLALSLTSNGIGDIGANSLFQAVMQHPSLQFLNLGYTPSTRALKAEANEIGRASVSVLSDFLVQNKQLYHLDLTKNKLNFIDFMSIKEALEQNKSLKTFKIGNRMPTVVRQIFNKLVMQNLADAPEAVFKKHPDIKMIKSLYR